MLLQIGFIYLKKITVLAGPVLVSEWVLVYASLSNLNIYSACWSNDILAILNICNAHLSNEVLAILNIYRAYWSSESLAI